MVSCRNQVDPDLIKTWAAEWGPNKPVFELTDNGKFIKYCNIDRYWTQWYIYGAEYDVKIRKDEIIVFIDKVELGKVKYRFNEKSLIFTNETGILNDLRDIYVETTYQGQRLDEQEAVSRNPKAFMVYYLQRGIAYAQKKYYDKAIIDFNMVIRLGSNNDEVYFYRGLSYQEKKIYDKAISDYTEAIQTNPNFARYHNRGVVYYHKKDYDKALKDFTEAIRLKPDLDKLYHVRGIIYYKKKNYDKAIEDLTKAISLKPDNTISYLWRSLTYFKEKNFSKSFADFSFFITLKIRWVIGLVVFSCAIIFLLMLRFRKKKRKTLNVIHDFKQCSRNCD
jgi:tetratricopeptide (TPR) repeat protein